MISRNQHSCAPFMKIILVVNMCVCVCACKRECLIVQRVEFTRTYVCMCVCVPMSRHTRARVCVNVYKCALMCFSLYVYRHDIIMTESYVVSFFSLIPYSIALKSGFVIEYAT